MGEWLNLALHLPVGEVEVGVVAAGSEVEDVVEVDDVQFVARVDEESFHRVAGVP